MIQEKIVSKRFGKVNPLSIDSYIKYDGYQGLQKAVTMHPSQVIDEIEKSRIRGRGGAGFPAHIKVRALANASGTKYIVCNADEGEPGNFKDRMLMENDPHSIIEGIAIVAYATGATKGYIYIRGEYQNAIKIIRATIQAAEEKGFLGKNILDKGFDFKLEVRSGAGSYVVGEEFSMIESIEGKPGRSRTKPPFPTDKGIHDRPTLINNVETFANFPHIILVGGEEFTKVGTQSSTGTKLISLSGNVKNKGLYEVPFGTSIRDVIFQLGKGVKNNRPIKMVQLGGASGPIIPEYMLDMSIDFDRFENFDSKTGTGAIIVMDDRFDLFDILLIDMKFFVHQSCGKCAPCREGHIQIVNLLNKFKSRRATEKDLMSLENLAHVIQQTSLCGLGQTSMTAIISSLRYFRDDYFARVRY
ncbi:MAG TPA: NADH-ubiquinone oxidoreductase-F iron-sulfur binding region domain-containing protein [Bacillota bacterium]|nr:NADH-ubiquinone oxidoreductase-F iron-sulfur binding region domain-containing protein [Bacillota bacterium]